MTLLEPVVAFIGRLSFRNKLRGFALIFGIPLLIASWALLHTINQRVSALGLEAAALKVQMPALNVLGRLHQLAATRKGAEEGDETLAKLLKDRKIESQQALAGLRRALADNEALASGLVGTVLANPVDMAPRIEASETADLDALIGQLRTDLDKLNEFAGLLNDGDAASSRLLGVVTEQLPALVDAAGYSAQIGSVVLIKQSVRGSRRSELTQHRGNFDALVLWSMDLMKKVAAEHPVLAASLDDAGSRLNTAFLALQEAITIKMLDTADFAMTPVQFQQIVQQALDDSAAIGNTVVAGSSQLISDRLATLVLERNIVLAAVVFSLLLVAAGFLAAYISIMRGLNGLSHAVDTMAAGDLNARVEVSSRDELGEVGSRFNDMAENLAQRTAELREKTNDIHSMLQNMPQGILTIVAGNRIHPEYSAFLESILERRELAGESAMAALFADSDVGTNGIDQIGATLAACLGEDRMNFDFNSHLLVGEIRKTLADGRVKILDFNWAPICDEHDVVEKILVCVRDVTELRALEAEAEHQKRELALIGQILKVSQEKFHEFIASGRGFLAENRQLLEHAPAHPGGELVNQLFRNMHTLKGNARTFGLLQLTNLVHEAEQAYDLLRQDAGHDFAPGGLLAQLSVVEQLLEEYAHLNEVTLGRKGPGRRGSAEKYVMADRQQLATLIDTLSAYQLRDCRPETLVALIEQVKLDLNLIGTEPLPGILAGVLEALPSLAAEIGKAVPRIVVEDHGIHVRNQASDLLRNVFMHLYRNSMDHGIEPADIRQAAGKPAAGTLRLSAALAEGQLRLRLADDGRGLALGRIRERAEARGLLEPGAPVGDEAIAQLIFAAGFSTAEQVTEVSGRGVGMDAVRSFLQRVGGDIRLVFVDNAVGAPYRAFEIWVLLPATLAVDAKNRTEITPPTAARPAVATTTALPAAPLAAHLATAAH